MKLGFSTLALFIKTPEEILDIAKENKFDMIEILSEGPHSPKYLLNNEKFIEPYRETDLEICLHGPDVDLNLASLNQGIRKESTRQMKEAIDAASKIGAKTVTIHPGKVGRADERIRKAALSYTIESIGEIVDYTKDKNVILSVENLPERFSFLGNRVEELEKIREETGCNITIDTGHANTCENTEEFFDLKGISYFHINDNNGIKDQHIPLGEGTLDLDLIKKINKGILELNTWEKIEKSKEVIKNLNL